KLPKIHAVMEAELAVLSHHHRMHDCAAHLFKRRPAPVIAPESDEIGQHERGDRVHRRRTIEKREAEGQQGENEKHGDEAPQPAPDEQATAPPRSLAPRFRTLFRFHHRYPHTILRSFFLPEYREPQGLAMPKASGLDGDGEWGHRSAMQEMTPLSFDELLAVHAGAVEDLLRNLLDERPREGEIARPERLLAAMRHGALNGGKRLRPFLLIESARLFGAQGEAVLRVAAALECVH